jgi:hypothetical protein
MFYVKLDSDGNLERYPYTLTDLRRDNPRTSFPKIITEEMAAGFNCVPAVPAAAPADDYTKNYERSVFNDAGTWREEWIETDATAEEITDRRAAQLEGLDYAAFWKEFTRSASYAALKSAATTDLSANVLATELIGVFSDAKTNNLDSEAMTLGVNQAVAALQVIDDALVTETEALLTAYGLNVYLQPAA